MIILDMGFHVVTSGVFVVTIFTLNQSCLAVSSLDVSVQFVLVGQNLATVLTINLLGLLVSSPLLFCHFAQLLVFPDTFALNSTI